MTTTDFQGRMDLTGVWRFQADPEGQGEALAYFEPGHDLRFWGEVDLPRIVDHCHPAIASYEGPAWYARDVRLPPAGPDRHWVLRLEGVNYRAAVWLEGRRLGEQAGGFLPLEWAIEEMPGAGPTRRLVLCVDNRRRAGDVPGLRRGWRPQGGVLRELYFESRPAVEIRDPIPRAESGGRLSVRFTVAGVKAGTGPWSADLTVEDDAGAVCERFSAPIAPALGAVCEIGGECRTVDDWSPEHPVLYTLRLVVREGGAVRGDERLIRTGFRTLGRDGGRLTVNGRPIFLRGFNRHDDSPATGLAVDRATIEADLRAMRAMGANFVRLCHYPHHPFALDLCDQLGLLVMDEIPLYWWDGAEEAATLRAATAQLEALIRRDRHHPSVAFWSVSNETCEEQPAVRAGNRALVRRARDLDPTRWAVHVAHQWGGGGCDFEADDVICVNHYPTVRGCLRDPRFEGAAAGAEWTRELTALSARYPGKPIVVAEFGYIAWAGVREGLLSEDRQADALAREFDGIRSAPAVCGAAIWCYADHPWPEEDFLNRVVLSPYGVVTRDRREKRACAAVRKMFEAPPEPPPPPEPADNRRVVMIRPHLRDLPEVPFAPGFGIRPMTVADAGLWEDIWRDAEPFIRVESGLFLREFGADPGAIPRRCFLITGPNGCAVGTISAWYDRDFQGRDYGRIHWVAVRPAWQGKGLAKAGLAHALKALAQWHEAAYLVTSSGRVGAIKLYASFGFVIAP